MKIILGRFYNDMLKKKAIFIFILLTVIVYPFFLTNMMAASNEYKGEKIIYEISPAGKAEYNDLGLVKLGEKMVNLTTFRTQVLGFDDTEKIYSDAESFLPLRVERNISMLGIKECLIEEYKPKDFSLTIKKFKNSKQVAEYKYKENGPIYNAILLPFYLRNLVELNIGWTLNIRLPDKFVVKLVSIEEIKVPAGKFKAYHFTSIPHKFEIWISKDELRIPLKIKGMGGLGYTLLMKKRTLKQNTNR